SARRWSSCRPRPQHGLVRGPGVGVDADRAVARVKAFVAELAPRQDASAVVPALDDRDERRLGGAGGHAASARLPSVKTGKRAALESETPKMGFRVRSCRSRASAICL